MRLTEDHINVYADHVGILIGDDTEAGFPVPTGGDPDAMANGIRSFIEMVHVEDDLESAIEMMRITTGCTYAADD